MAFESLTERINKQELPLILCGPILRRVDPDSVTVWVALREPRIVTLRVFSRGDLVLDGSRLKIEMVGTRKTTGLGNHLHIVAITASVDKNDQLLRSGEQYYYNLFFHELDYMSEGVAVVPEDSKDLHSDYILNTPGDKKLELHYSKIYPNIHEELHLPTFSLPPDDLDSLRIIHGSCRKLHNEGLDAMPGIDDILEFDWIDPNLRPHMLFLTGDQIYADDISDTTIFLLDDASTALMGWEEQLPCIDNVKDLLPGNRKEVIKKVGGFTTINEDEDSHNHLLRLGEYYVAYLFSWSDVLWPQEKDFPEFEEVYHGKPPRKPFRHNDGTLPTRDEYKAYNRYLKNKKTAKEDKPNLQELRRTLNKVRRALANIPTYMIFDDHDVTDDWNMDREWCERTLKKKLGYRVTQNALLAYAVFQAWGNTPTQFKENENIKGNALLQEAHEWSNSYGTNEEIEKNIACLVGLPKFGSDIFTSDIDDNKILKRSDKALDWHYVITGPKFEVIVLDTRTRHSYPGGKHAPATLLSASAFINQIDEVKQDPETLVTFVIAPTPVITFPFFRTVLFWLLINGYLDKAGFLLTFGLSGKWTRDLYEFDLPDHWQNQERPFELLIAKLASRRSEKNNKRETRVIILTGDVHFSSANRLRYWADRPFTEDASTPLLPTEAIFAHFSASSFKKQDRKTKYLHTHGYEFNELVFALHLSKVPLLSTILDSINREPETTSCFGLRKFNPKSGKEEPEMYIDGNLAWLWDRWKFRDFAKFNPPRKFDWIYRIDSIIAENEVREPAKFEPREVILPVDEEDRIESLKNYLAMSNNHESYAKKLGNGKEIIGVNNFCEISFNWNEEGQKTVIQKSWWRLKSKSNDEKLLQIFPLSKFSVSLEFDDSRYKIPDINDIIDTSVVP